MKTVKINKKCNFWKIIFQNFPKSVENRFRQVPQVDLDLQNSKKIAKTPQNSKNRQTTQKTIFLTVDLPLFF